MLTKTVDVYEAQTHWRELLSLVVTGTEIILTEGNTPAARLVSTALPTAPRVAGLHAGAIWMSDDAASLPSSTNPYRRNFEWGTYLRRRESSKSWKSLTPR